MLEETPWTINESGSQQVRIVLPFNSSGVKHTAPTWLPARMTPLAAMKNSSAVFLSRHLQTLLRDFIKSVSETFALSYATCFYKKIRSGDLLSNPSYVPSSTKFYFKTMLIDDIKTSKNVITLSERMTAYVETTQHDLAQFAAGAVEINCQEFVERNVQAICRLLHTHASRNYGKA